MERWSVFCIMQKTTVCKRQKLSIIRLYMQSYKRHLLWLECMTCCKKVNWSTLKPYFSGRNKESVAASESIHSLENKSPYPRDKRWKDELRRQWTRPSHLYLLNCPDLRLNNFSLNKRIIYPNLPIHVYKTYIVHSV